MERPHSEHEKAHFVDANGRDVWLSRKNAALIVAAVNGRAALAAVLRDMEEDCEAAWEGTPLRRALAKYAARLREIAGEGETPTGKGVGE
jgi:hypothetical protein